MSRKELLNGQILIWFDVKVFIGAPSSENVMESGSHANPYVWNPSESGLASPATVPNEVAVFETVGSAASFIQSKAN